MDLRPFFRGRGIRPVEVQWPIPAGFLILVLFKNGETDIGSSRINLGNKFFLDPLPPLGISELQRFAPKIVRLCSPRIIRTS